MKKALRCALFTILLLLLTSPIWIWFAAPVIDDMALSRLRADILKDIPPEQVVEVVSGCGNTGGAGNHTELYVAVLVRGGSSSQPITQGLLQTPEMRSLDLSFSFNDGSGYHIVDRCKSAPCSWFDLRGH